MALKKLVSIKEAVTQFLDETSEDYISRLPVLIRWAKQCDLRIGSYYSYRKNYYTRLITNARVELPLSTAHVFGIVLGQHLDNAPQIFSGMITTRSDEQTINGEQIVFAWDNISVNTISTRILWEIQDNCIVFSGNMHDGQYLTIATLNYQEDSDGFPLIIEGHIQAIAEYLKIKMIGKEQWKKFLGNKMTSLDRAFLDDTKKQYRFEVRQAIANDGDWTDDEIAEVSKMIGYPFSGNGSLNLY